MTELKKVNDLDYWENFYAERKDPFPPSPFAQYVARNYLKSSMSLIELGCGNARDAVFLAKNGVITTAVDQCEKEIEYLSKKYQDKSLSFVSGDFTALSSKQNFDCVYSRFTLHSISAAGMESLFNWMGLVVNKSGYCFLEFRTLKNDLYGLGQPVNNCNDAFIFEGHYRRFLNIDRVCEKLKSIGMDIIEAKEDTGFSPTKTTDEVFGRIVARATGMAGTPVRI
jgi:tellurite methyltransferase